MARKNFKTGKPKGKKNFMNRVERKASVTTQNFSRERLKKSIAFMTIYAADIPIRQRCMKRANRRMSARQTTGGFQCPTW